MDITSLQELNEDMTAQEFLKRINENFQYLNDNIDGMSITTDKIQDNAVTTDKIQYNAVTTDKIQDGSVTEKKIQDGSVTKEKILNGSVTLNKLSEEMQNRINNTRRILIVGSLETNNGKITDKFNGDTVLQQGDIVIKIPNQ